MKNLDIQIEDFFNKYIPKSNKGLYTKLYISLKNAHCNSTQDIRNKNLTQLKNIHGIGKISLDILIKGVKQFCLDTNLNYKCLEIEKHPRMKYMDLNYNKYYFHIEIKENDIFVNNFKIKSNSLFLYNERDKFIIIHRLGSDKLTLNQIAEKFYISKQRVKQLQDALALKIKKQYVYDLKLKGQLYELEKYIK